MSPAVLEVFSIAVLVAFVVGLAAAAAWQIYRLRAECTFTQGVLVLVSALYARIVWRTQVHGRIDIPFGQGAVVVSNHASGVDPWFTKLASTRIMHYMVASEFFYQKALHWFFRTVMAIPVNRGGIDTSATKQAIRYAEAGRLVGIFPEGRINITREVLLPGRPGALLVALKARVPVQICYIKGAPFAKTVGGTFLTRAKTHIYVGPLLDISLYYGREKEEGVLQMLTLRVLKEIAILAGRPDFEPRLAGKNWKPRDDE